ncbi:MAG TPA: T9SS type A sorting domain-containing protein [Bacteroides sp.]|mgnify:CR=1 FL=1|nr:T9SS type A sorting domain-containing protein [Bacteroides sp.]
MRTSFLLAGSLRFEPNILLMKPSAVLSSACLVFMICLPAKVHPQDTVRWVRTGGPPGGLGYDIRYNPDLPHLWFVTDANGGVHRSEDNGYHWEPANQGIATFSGFTNDNIPAFCLTVNPHNPAHIWAGTQNSGHLYKSVDLGLTWTESDEGISVEHDALSFRGITFDPASPDIMYAMGEITSEALGGPYVWGNGTGGVIYKSTNGGQNWFKIWDGGIPSSLARYMWIDPRNTNVLYVSTGIFDRGAVGEGDLLTDPFGGIGILKSVDGGETWEVQDENNGLRCLYLGSLYMHPLNPDTLLTCAGHVLENGRGVLYLENLVMSGGTSPFGIYRTVNGGNEWTQVYEPGKNIGEIFSSVEYSTFDPDIAYAASGMGVYRSEDAGGTWNRVSSGSVNWGPPGVDPGYPIDIQCDPRDPDRLFINNYGGGNFLSEDGGMTWTNASDGYTGAELRKVEVSPPDPALAYATGRSGIWKSEDAGTTWYGIHFPADTANFLGDYASVLPDRLDRDHLLAGTTGGHLIESFDGGFTWSVRWPGFDELGELISGGGEISDIAVAPSNKEILYAGISVTGCSLNNEGCQTGKGVVFSRNGGATWVPSDDPAISGLAVVTLAVDPEYANRVYAGTGAGLFISTDGGSGWEIAPGLPESGIIRAIAFNPQNRHTLFVAIDQFGLYYSEDGGVTWNASVAGLEPNSSIREILFDPGDTATMYVCDLLSGIYRSEDRGGTWLKINRGLLNRAVTSLSLTMDGQHLYASTTGAGVFRCDLNGEVPVSPGTGVRYGVPAGEPDFLVYPNPAEDFIHISGAGEAERIELFNALGMLLHSGAAEELIRLPESPPGLYFLVIHSLSGQVFCRRVVIR